jgi:hypothetical protein
MKRKSIFRIHKGFGKEESLENGGER